MVAMIAVPGLPQMPDGGRDAVSTAVRDGKAVSRYGSPPLQALRGGLGHHGSFRQERPSLTETLCPTEPLPHREITVHFDGSCLGNPGPGGYAAILTNTLTDARRIVKGHPKTITTNNCMELMAAIRALQFIQPGAFVTMIGDSEYVIKGITGRMQSWKAKGWRTSAGTRAKNVELWLELEEACLRPAQLDWRWQKGHAGCAMNAEADRIAKAEADAAKVLIARKASRHP